MGGKTVLVLSPRRTVREAPWKLGVAYLRHTPNSKEGKNMTQIPTDEEIVEGRKRTVFHPELTPKFNHDDHPDCYRIAYQWLDAQVKTKHAICSPCKHIIEGWAKRHISVYVVAVAAELHPDISGSYPYINLSRRFVLPSSKRLVGISEVGRDHYECFPEHYGSAEFMTLEEWRGWCVAHPNRCPIE